MSKHSTYGSQPNTTSASRPQSRRESSESSFYTAHSGPEDSSEAELSDDEALASQRSNNGHDGVRRRRSLRTRLAHACRDANGSRATSRHAQHRPHRRTARCREQGEDSSHPGLGGPAPRAAAASPAPAAADGNDVSGGGNGHSNLWYGLAVGGATVVGGLVVAPVLAPAAVGLLGFGANGIVAGSVATGIQAGIGNIAAGSAFAVAQSVGAGGALPAIGTIVGGAIPGAATAIGLRRRRT